MEAETSIAVLDHFAEQPESTGFRESYRSSVHLAIWVFLTFQFFYVLTSTGRVRTADEYNTLYTTQSLVLRASTAVPQAVELHNFYGRYDLSGQPRAAYPPLHALLCTPWYAIGQYVLSHLPGVPAQDIDLIVGFSTCLSSATFAALAVCFFFLLLRQLGVSASASLLATALVGLGTPIFSYSAWLFSEPLSAAVLLGTALLVFWRRHQPITVSRAAVAGLMLGMMTWIRPTNVLAIAVFALAMVVRDGKAALRSAAVLCLASGVGTVALLVRDVRLFGNPFDFGYPTTAGGVKLENSFDTPLATGLWGFLLSPGKSVFLFAPPVLLAIAGLPRLWKMDRGLTTLATVFPLTYLLFYARYAYWEGGYCVGPRYLVPAIPLLCLGLGACLAAGAARARIAAITCLVLGAAVQIISLATSFLEDQNPARGRYYDAHWHYRLGYSLTGQVELLWKYLQSGQPPTLGLGWDRWFVFLHNGAVSAATLWCLGLLGLAALASSIVGLVRTVGST
jgi:hypothetical protein